MPGPEIEVLGRQQQALALVRAVERLDLGEVLETRAAL